MIRIIAKRYARALADLGAAKQSVDKAREDLAAFTAAAGSHPEMEKLFTSPVFTPENKKSVVQEIAKRLGLQQDTARFLEHLAENGRIRFLREINEAFGELMAERQNRASVRITSAAQLSPAELGEIKKTLEGVTGKTVEIDARVDASVIGGVRAQIGSVIYDGTIKNQLGKMRSELAQ